MDQKIPFQCLLKSPDVAASVIPLWQIWFNILGISSLIGAVLAHLLSWRRERLKWINDNKKAEWRELIDELEKDIEKMRDTADDDKSEWIAEVFGGYRVIGDRIFIANTLKEIGLLEKWRTLIRTTADGPGPVGPSLEFKSKATALHDELIAAARKDLGL